MHTIQRLKDIELGMPVFGINFHLITNIKKENKIEER
jgi:hypothetical protein